MKHRIGLALALPALIAGPLAARDPAPDPKTETEHVVRPNETLGAIAVRAGVDRVLIIEANGLKPPYVIKAGQKLVIPRAREHVVKPGETGLSIALDEGIAWSAIAAANGLDPKAPLKPGRKLLIPTSTSPSPDPAPSPTPSPTPGPGPLPIEALPPDTARPPKLRWPVEGEVSRRFAPRTGKTGFHDGIDIAGDIGDAVRASAAGKVIFAGQGPDDYGLTVIVYHEGRWTTTYAFLDKVTVEEGKKVKAGERVGKLGQSGVAKRPSLHFEVRRNRVALDPLDYLPDQTR